MRFGQEIQAVPRAAELTDNDRLPVKVVVGVVIDSERRVLINQRPAGKPMAGAWEFPGGKLERGESAWSGLSRELHEELGIDVLQAEPLLDLTHEYPELIVHLDVWWVSRWAGKVSPRDGQSLRWIEACALDSVPLLPADAPIVKAIAARLSAA